MIILTKDKRNNVNDYLNKIADITTGIIKSNINDLISIIISGGFGKGEGSAVVKQGKVIPINDFDVYIVTLARCELIHNVEICSRGNNVDSASIQGVEIEAGFGPAGGLAAVRCLEFQRGPRDGRRKSVFIFKSQQVRNRVR